MDFFVVPTAEPKALFMNIRDPQDFEIAGDVHVWQRTILNMQCVMTWLA